MGKTVLDPPQTDRNRHTESNCGRGMTPSTRFNGEGTRKAPGYPVLSIQKHSNCT